MPSTNSKRTVRVGAIWLPAVVVTACLSVGGIAVLKYAFTGPTPESVAAGKVLFEHEFTPNDPLCGDGDGLGPVFNATSCVACHFQGGTGGSGPNQFNVTTFEALPVPGRSEVVAGGIHQFATSSELQETVESLQQLFPSVPGAIQVRSGCTIETRPFDPLQLEELNTPALFGLAEIERIQSSAITLHGAKRSFGKMSREFGGDFDGTGIGRLRHVSMNRIGRFGWKGQFATVAEFVANACAMELGLTNPKVAQPVPGAYESDEDAKLDMDRRELKQLVAFVQSLPRPEQVIPEDARLAAMVHTGEEVFARIGCTDCHVPNIGGVEGVYSDFHLYDLEDDNVDKYVEPDFDPAFTLPFEHPRPSEWQTPPLWGVADSAPYFHDGQSSTLKAAIERHGRDGATSRDNFKALASHEKQSLIAFLKSLRAPASASTIASAAQ